MKVMRIVRGVKFATVVLAALAIAGCAKQQIDQTAMAGSAAPGSQQDFVVNVGDRVFFETDSTELTPQARTTLDKQAQWLSNYGQYAFTVEGHADERGTREYNIALGARRAQTRARISRLPRGVGPAHAYHLVWQGTAGRAVQRHFLLVAEPPRRDGPQSELIACAIGAAEQVEAKAPPDCWDPDARVLRALHPAFAVTRCGRTGWPNCGPRVTIWTQDGLC